MKDPQERGEGWQQMPGLDAVRFCAAAMVMWFHLAYWTWAPPGGYATVVRGMASFPAFTPTAAWGWVGVQIFFVLSGVVISFSAESKSAYAFLRSRFLRLYPAVWICASITIGVAFLLGEASLIAYAKSLTLFPDAPWVDGAYWTLGVEISFYALVFVMLWLNCFEALAGVLCSLGLVSAALWALWLAAYTSGVQADLLEKVARARISELMLIPHGIYFALGGIIYLLAHRGMNKKLLLVALVCVAAACVEIYSMAMRKALGAGAPAYATSAIVAWLLSVIAIACSVRWTFGRWSGLLRTLGLMTYPLYLLHGLMGAAIIYALCSYGVPPLAALASAIVAALGLSFTVIKWLEPVLRSFTARLFDRSLSSLPIPTLYRATMAIRPRLDKDGA